MMSAALAAASRLVCGANAEWHCARTAERQRIYFANHASHLDFIVIWAALPPDQRPLARPVAGQDYWDRGPVRRYLSRRVFNAVLIERNTSGAQHAATMARMSIERMADEMGARHSLIVFPEGTRSITGDIAPFKSGLYHLARLRPDAELVPVHLENLNRILPKGESLPVPMLSRLVFGSPLALVETESKDEFLIRARTALMQLGAVS
jgi:1-acyl-sn-glycerol-3-phosphate acyltransferase